VLPANEKTVTHLIGPFCYLSIRFGQKLPISPLAGEMSGRTEGGVKERGATVPFLIPKIIAAAQAG
ncbi:MAG: hypothetical protein EOQ47_26805, partial [Mesorhizobium sp.]